MKDISGSFHRLKGKHGENVRQITNLRGNLDLFPLFIEGEFRAPRKVAYFTWSAIYLDSRQHMQKKIYNLQMLLP